MDDKQEKLMQWIVEIQAIGQAGLTYTQNAFDKQRYNALLKLASQMASEFSGTSLNEIELQFFAEKDYPTPKLDVRAFVLKEGKLLMVKEQSDGLWTLPGGWADVNESPSEAVAREVYEETGFNVTVNQLLALWDKQKHEHPPQWPHAYKCFFHCDIVSGKPTLNLEVSEIDFFPIDKLPPLSTHRVTKNQLLTLFEMLGNNQSAVFD